jgi:hypothetical protein
MTRRTALKSLSAAALTAWQAKAAKVSHRLIAQDKGVIAIIDAQGAVEWVWESRRGAHDLHLLPNGNVLAPTGRGPEITEVTSEKEVVWQWRSEPVPPYDGRIEIHGFERYANGNTMIAETGNMRVIEVDRDKKIVSEVKLKVDNPHYHRDTRLVRKTPAGTYLVPHEGDGVVREYNANSEVIWEYRLSLTGPESGGHMGHGTHVYSAYRLPSGNTLIGGGNNNRVLEVNPKGDIVWSIEQNELPGIKLFWVAQLHYLPNGNIVVTNAHAGPDYPQIFEITRNKEVVWTFLNWDTFGDNLTANQILDAGPGVIR